MTVSETAASRWTQFMCLFVLNAVWVSMKLPQDAAQDMPTVHNICAAYSRNSPTISPYWLIFLVSTICVCACVWCVCVGLIAGRMFVLPAGQTVDMWHDLGRSRRLAGRVACRFNAHLNKPFVGFLLRSLCLHTTNPATSLNRTHARLKVGEREREREIEYCLHNLCTLSIIPGNC